MFDRYDAGEQAVLVHIYFTQDKDMEDLQEFESLVLSLIHISETTRLRRNSYDDLCLKKKNRAQTTNHYRALVHK
ncbi:MAG TPA: hypothetical protein DDZ03_08055 [Shigella sp.]|nr:hypothetical protein [Shigella sp.]